MSPATRYISSILALFSKFRTPATAHRHLIAADGTAAFQSRRLILIDIIVDSGQRFCQLLRGTEHSKGLGAIACSITGLEINLDFLGDN